MGERPVMIEDAYWRTRLPFDRKRERLWRALWRFYFSKYIAPSDCVLELGCGYAHFINNVQARRRIAVDSWSGFLKYLAAGIEGHVGDVANLAFLGDSSVDFVFASNLFEHLTKDNFALVLDQLRPKLTNKGKLTILQPNYRYAYKEYFDDYTHVSVYSHESLCDFLAANGYNVVQCVPRFMPLTIKNHQRIVSEQLVGLYLSLPVRPLGKQMLVMARPCQA
jgi:SAM-dependent methyltransferase